MTVLDIIRQKAHKLPDKPALIHHGERISYASLHRRMLAGAPLPVPLLGKTWDGDFLLHTTGTTGKSKTVVISQEAVIANSENLICGQGYSEQTVFVATGALEHLGNWSKLFPVWMVGGTVIMLDGMRHIDAFFEALDLGCGLYDGSRPRLAAFLVPANIRILLQFCTARLASYAEKIDFIETGGAPMARADMVALCAVLPQSRLYNTYASTETGIVATYNYNDGRSLASCCGKPLKHSRVAITPDGRIACQGATLMSGYLNEPDMTDRVLRRDADGTLTLYTMDNGFMDEDGRLHILGRADDIINVGGLKVAPTEVEEVAMMHDDVDDCVCIATPHPVLGSALKLLVVSHKTLDKKGLSRFIAQHLDRYKVPHLYEAVDQVVRNANGKVDRKRYCSARPQTGTP